MSRCRGWKYDLGEMTCWVCYSLVEPKHFRARAEKLSNLYLHFDESSGGHMDGEFMVARVLSVTLRLATESNPREKR